MVAGALMAGVGEELVFRGLSAAPGWLAVSALLFGAAHYVRRSLRLLSAWAVFEGLAAGGLHCCSPARSRLSWLPIFYTTWPGSSFSASTEAAALREQLVYRVRISRLDEVGVETRLVCATPVFFLTIAG